MAQLAEQDNRVKIPNGTAAVNAQNISSMVKTGHWRNPGRLKIFSGLQPPGSA